MAIIYSYPKVTSPLATDVLILTDTTLTAGKRKNKTKSLAMSDLAAYVVSSTSGITGGGTFNTIPLWTPDGFKLGNSIITQASTAQGVTVTGQLEVTSDFNVAGSTELFSTLEVQGASTFSNVSFQGVVFDGGGNPGTAGQVLSSTGAGGDTEWINNTDANTTYNLFGATSNVNEYAISLSGSDGSLDKVNLIPGSNITLTSSATGVTIDAADSDINGSGTANYITKWTDTDTIESASNLKLSSSTLLEFGDDFSDSARKIQVKADQYPEIRLQNSDNFFVQQMRPGGGFAFTNGSNNARVFTLYPNSLSNCIVTHLAGVNLMAHSDPGNVGIGWSNPSTTPARLSLTGNGTTDIFNIYSDSVGTNQYMTVKSTGNVGIGTTSPIQKLDVNGNIAIFSTSASSGSGQISMVGGRGSFGYDGSISSAFMRSSDTSKPLVFGSGASEFMRIVSSTGNVGIGTTSPSARLEVQGTNSNTQAAFKVTDSGDSFFEVVPDNNTTFKIGDLDAVGDEAMIVGTFSDITFSKGGTTTMILDSNNRVGIGTASPVYKLDVAGEGRFTGVLRCLSLVQTSQTDKKEGIHNIDKTKAKAIQFKEYRYKEDRTSRKRYGVLAEDLEKEYPELVYTGADGVKGISYTDLLIKRVAELEQELEQISVDGLNGNVFVNKLSKFIGIGTTKPGAKLEVVGDLKMKDEEFLPHYLTMSPGRKDVYINKDLNNTVFFGDNEQPSTTNISVAADIESRGGGLVLTSPKGLKFKITVDDRGGLTSSPV